MLEDIRNSIVYKKLVKLGTGWLTNHCCSFTCREYMQVVQLGLYNTTLKNVNAGRCILVHKDGSINISDFLIHLYVAT